MGRSSVVGRQGSQGQSRQSLGSTKIAINHSSINQARKPASPRARKHAPNQGMVDARVKPECR